MRRYPSSKVRSSSFALLEQPLRFAGAAAALCWNSHEEIPHIHGKRNPSKTIGVARGHQRADTQKP